MRVELKKLLLLHVMAVLLTVGCLLIADVHTGRALFLLPAGVLLLAVFGTMRELYIELLRISKEY